MARLNPFIGPSKELDEAALVEREEILFSADIGVHTAPALLESVRRNSFKRRELSDIAKVRPRARGDRTDPLQSSGAPAACPSRRAPGRDGGGVNGTGKDQHHRQGWRRS